MTRRVLALLLVPAFGAMVACGPSVTVVGGREPDAVPTSVPPECAEEEKRASEKARRTGATTFMVECLYTQPPGFPGPGPHPVPTEPLIDDELLGSDDQDPPRLPASAMGEQEFWRLVGLLKGSSDEAAVERLEQALRARGRPTAQAFAERLAERMYRLDTEAHFEQPVRWSDDPPGAKPLPLSEDTFLDLRAGIIAEGKATYDAVLADPTLLTSRKWDDGEFLLYAADEAAGEHIETAFSYETGSNTQRWS